MSIVVVVVAVVLISSALNSRHSLAVHSHHTMLCLFRHPNESTKHLARQNAFDLWVLHFLCCLYALCVCVYFRLMNKSFSLWWMGDDDQIRLSSSSTSIASFDVSPRQIYEFVPFKQTICVTVSSSKSIIVSQSCVWLHLFVYTTNKKPISYLMCIHIIDTIYTINKGECV